MTPQVSWKLFWAVVGAALTLGAAGLPTLLGVGPLVVIPAFLALAVMFALAAARVVHGSAMFRDMSQQGKGQVVWLIRAGIGLHVAWMVALQLRPDLWLAWVLTLAGLAALEYGTARGHEYLLNQLTPRVRNQAGVASERPRRDMEKPEKVLDAALERSGYSGLTVLGWESIGEDDKP